MVLHVHKQRLDQLSLTDVANDFVHGSDHRKTVFGTFDAADLHQKNNFNIKSVFIQVNMNKS